MPFDVGYELLWPRLDGHGARPDVDLLSWPQRRIGFVLRIAASLFWVAFGIVAGTTAGIVANVAVILLSLSGLKQWRS